MLNLHNVLYPSICGDDVILKLIWVKLIQELLSVHEDSISQNARMLSYHWCSIDLYRIDIEGKAHVKFMVTDILKLFSKFCKHIKFNSKNIMLIIELVLCRERFVNSSLCVICVISNF